MDHHNRNDTHALHTACAMGSPDIVELLLRKKADVDCRNQLSQTPLIVAAENDQAEIIKHLLEVNFRPKLYTVAQLNVTTEIEVFYMLIERSFYF